MKNNNNFNLKTAADIKAERIRLQGQVKEKENELKNEILEVKDKFNPIPGITSLFNSDKQNRSTRAVLDTSVNFLVGSLIKKRIGFLPTVLTPFVSRTISDQVMKLNVQPYLIQALDWVIEKTEVEDEEFTPELNPVMSEPVRIIEREPEVFSGN